MGLGMGEILVIILAALVFLKPEDLPQIAAKAGRLIRTVRGIRLKELEEIDLTDGKKAG